MSFIKIEVDELEKAINKYFVIDELVNDAVERQLEFRMSETKVVGWFFKKTVNKVAYELSDNPFSRRPNIKENLDYELRKRLLIVGLHPHVNDYRAMVMVCPQKDRYDIERGYIYADDTMCWFINRMDNITGLDVEKKAATLWTKVQK